MAKRCLLFPKQTVLCSLNPVFDVGLMEVPDSLFGEIILFQKNLVLDTELLSCQRLNDFYSRSGVISSSIQGVSLQQSYKTNDLLPAGSI